MAFPFKPGTEATAVKGDSVCRISLYILFIRKGNYSVGEMEKEESDQWWAIDRTITVKLFKQVIVTML